MGLAFWTCISMYSHCSNNRGGWNKHGGKAKIAESLNVEAWINVEVPIRLLFQYQSIFEWLTHRPNKRQDLKFGLTLSIQFCILLGLVLQPPWLLQSRTHYYLLTFKLHQIGGTVLIAVLITVLIAPCPTSNGKKWVTYYILEHLRSVVCVTIQIHSRQILNEW